uniref:Peptidase M43 pregnancy-associated plasma-A domain-containing protein n=1 Tax=Tetradesmus obliquus TaxID=3088 RepID=A0A383WEZ8_TETOB|eukprot:jgi/Sobl393_1/1842/SZX76197.1
MPSDSAWAHLLGGHWDLKRRAAAVLLLALLLGIGLIAGYFAGDALASSSAAAAQQASRSSSATRDSGSLPRLLRGLPELGSEGAAALLADPDTPDIVRGLYVFANDSATISADIVAGFLRALKAAQDAHQPPGGSSSLDVEPFIPLAADLLGYFRTAFSAALLPLLRLYAASGGTQLALTAVSPDLLQQELASLLNSSSLNAYYTQTARGCGTRPTAAAAAGGATLLAGSGGQAAGKRRRLSAAGTARLSSRRRLQQGAGTAQAMVCSVRQYLPPGAQPPAACPAVAASSSSSPQLGFIPVAIPVVFHCLGFIWPGSSDGGAAPSLYLPQLVGDRLQAAARNLIDAANRHYNGTGVQFKFQAVRQDASAHAYLNLGTMQDWQHCTPHPNSDELDARGMACLARLALAPSVARLASRHVINVFVSGSNREDYCAEDDQVCRHSLAGLAHADGPWWNTTYADKLWREGDSAKNWVWLRWIHFDPDDFNRGEWQDGGTVLAHELGHYLGLLHTHEGGCQAGLPGQGDQVPDTAPQLTLEELQGRLAAGPAAAGTQPAPQLGVGLAGWCTAWRAGRQPPAADLQHFNSCPTPPPGKHASDQQIDGVFNLMSYVPAACSMLLTPGQVTRLQRAIAAHRPAMMAAHKAR